MISFLSTNFPTKLDGKGLSIKIDFRPYPSSCKGLCEYDEIS